jgi:rSAM/selenodomain-associated transferase 1
LVKTRLAAEIGARPAAALYRRMACNIVARCVRPASYRTVVWYAPTHGGAAVRQWLGGLGVADFLPQAVGDLGLRLSAAFLRHFRDGARRVAIVGSDCPAVDAGLVEEAFAALMEHDLVLGPAHDGGYYLIGLDAPHVALFRDIPWSTEAVLDRTIANARRLGLDYLLLPRHRDVDAAADARALGLLPLTLDGSRCACASEPR